MGLMQYEDEARLSVLSAAAEDIPLHHGGSWPQGARVWGDLEWEDI